MSRISLGSLSSNFRTGAKTVGRVGTWPVRKSGRAMKSAGSGSANAARSFVHARSTERRFQNWAVKRDEAKAAKDAEKAKRELGFVKASGAAFTFANALADGDIGTAAGAMALLREKCAEPVHGVKPDAQEIAEKMDSEIKGALDKLTKDQQRFLSELPLEDTANKISKNANIPQEETKKILEKAQDLAAIKTTISTAQKIAGNVLNISEQGEVTGTFTHVTSNISHVLGDGKPTDFASYLEERSNTLLKGSNESFKTINGISIPNKHADDVYRMHFLIGDEGYDTYKSGFSNTSEQDAHLKRSVGKLRALTGSDEATGVIASALHQHFLRDTVRGARNDKGQEISFSPVGSGYEDVRIYKPDGNYESFDSKQIAAARVKVTKTDEGNFRFDVKWPILAKEIHASGEKLPINPKNPKFSATTKEEGKIPFIAIKSELAGCFIISGDQARKGEMKIVSSDLVQNVSGMINKPH